MREVRRNFGFDVPRTAILLSLASHPAHCLDCLKSVVGFHLPETPLQPARVGTATYPAERHRLPATITGSPTPSARCRTASTSFSHRDGNLEQPADPGCQQKRIKQLSQCDGDEALVDIVKTAGGKGHHGGAGSGASRPVFGRLRRQEGITNTSAAA